MCVRRDVGDIPPFRFDADDALPCTIDSILQDDSEIVGLERYRLKNEMIEWIDIWNEFIRGIKCERMPGFPVWADSLCAIEDNPMVDDWNGLPAWKRGFIEKNSALWAENREFIDGWLVGARKSPLFFGSKAKLEWQAGESDSPNIWDNIMQVRPSGLRVKPGTYFPALVAITQTSIVGKRKRYLTPRECARLQSFPDTFICDDDDSMAYKQFGNSVNVALVELFAKYMFGDDEVRLKYSGNDSLE